MLEEERREIDLIDQQLIPLLEQRWDVIMRVAQKKREHHIPIHDANREQAILESIAQKVKNPKYTDSVQKIYQNLFELSRNDQETFLKQ